MITSLLIVESSLVVMQQIEALHYFMECSFKRKFGTTVFVFLEFCSLTFFLSFIFLFKLIYFTRLLSF